MFIRLRNILSLSVILLILGYGVSVAQTTLRMQNHQNETSLYGVALKKFVEDVHLMSGGDLKIEMFYNSSVVPTSDTFDAAKSGILDCDVTNGSYQTGKNEAFQFVSDTMGGYDTPMQYQSWVERGGGREAINELYAPHNMTFVGAHIGGQESLNSTRPLRGINDLENFKFRSPPGMESDIFASLGAKPVVMDFTEIITALESGIIDGADAASLAINMGIGIYDVAKHTTFPGFHSMAADHLACRTDKWNSLTDRERRIIESAYKNVAFDVITQTILDNGEALAKAPGIGLTIYDWSPEDRAKFRSASQAAWQDWGSRTPEAKKMVESHERFLKRIGLVN